MNKFIIVLVISFLYSCKKQIKNKNTVGNNIKTVVVEEATIPIEKFIKFKEFYDSIPNIALPFSNENMSKYIVFENYDMHDNISTKTDLVYGKLPKHISDNNKFISNSKRISYKSTEKSDYLVGNYFYPVNKFRKDSIYLIVFLYQDFEDIMPAVKTQLNSYNKNGKVLDTLVLDNKFHFELIYKNNFVIEDDFSISITEHIINYYDDLDNLMPKSSLPRIDKKTYSYHINNYGNFEKSK